MLGAFFTNVLDNHCPLKKVRISNKHLKQKYNDDIHNIRKSCDLAHSQAIQSSLPEHWLLYKSLKNKCNNLIKTAKSK